MTIPEGVDRPPIEQEVNPEDYRPDGMPKWKVGMRVRWRISGECGYRCERCGMEAHAGQCPSCLKATTGVISSIDNKDEERLCGDDCTGFTVGHKSHDIFIRIHDAKRGSYCIGFWAAASELIPLEPTTNLQKE